MSRRPVVLFAAAAAAALATPAAAFVRSTSAKNGAPLFWPQPAVPYVVSNLPASHSPSCGTQASDAPALAAVNASFAAWEQDCSALQLVYAGRIPDMQVGLGSSGEHLVVFRQGFCSQNPAAVACGCMTDPDVDCGNEFNCFEDSGGMTRNVVALTSVLYDENSGRIVDADIEMNGWDGEVPGSSVSSGQGGPVHGWYFTCDKQEGWSQCTTYGEGGCWYMDLQNTLTHEVGHFVGLAHVCEAAQGTCRAELVPITMYPATSPGDVDKRTLDADDVNGVCAIYSGRSSSSGGGGCASAGVAPAATALLLAAAALRRRRRARSA